MSSRLFLVALVLAFLSSFAVAQTGPLAPGFAPVVDQNCSHSQYSAQVWLGTTMQKIIQGSGTINPGAACYITINATQGEFADFQVHSLAPVGGFASLSITTTSFVCSTGPTCATPFTIQAPSTSQNGIVVYREAYVPVSSSTRTQPASSPPTSYYGIIGNYPDPLIPAIDPYYHQVTNAFPVAVTAGNNQSAWVDVFIPPSAPSGFYLGSVVVSNGGSTISTMPVTIGVWQWPAGQGGRMPATSLLPNELQYGYSAFCKAVYNDINNCGTYPGGLNQADTDGVIFMIDHRWSSGDPLECSGAQCTNLFSGATPASGAKPINVGATVSAQTSRIGPWGTMEPGTPAQVTTATAQAFANFFGAVKSTYPFGSTGTYPKVEPFYYCTNCNEPGGGAAAWTKLCSNAQIAHFPNTTISGANAQLMEGTIQQLNNNASASGCPAIGGSQNSVDIMVVNTTCMWPNGAFTCSGGGGVINGNNRSQYSAWLAHTNPDGITPQIWNYTSCSGAGTCGGAGPANQQFDYPSYNADQRPGGNRALEWMTYLNGEVGELYYLSTGTLDNATPGNPWTGGLYSFGQQGDGWLIYVSTVSGTHFVTLQGGGALSPEIWIPRIPLKHSRDGLQDYEYFNALTVAGQASFVTTQIGTFMTNPFTYDFSGATLLTARTNMGAALHELTYPLNSLPQPPTAPTISVF